MRNGLFLLNLFFLGILYLPQGLQAQNIYVSRTGSDSNSGSSESAPIASIKRANELLASRSSSAVTVFFRRGDTFDVDHTTARPALTIRDRSVSTRVSAYGTSSQRPRVRFLGSNQAHSPTVDVLNSKNVTLEGIYVFAANPARNFQVGIRIKGGGSENITIRDLVVNRFYHNILLSGDSLSYRLKNVTLDQVRLVNAGSDDANFGPGLYISSSGMYVERVQGLNIRNSLIANNGIYYGSNRQVPTFSHFTHAIYISHGDVDTVLGLNIENNLFLGTHPFIPHWPESNSFVTRNYQNIPERRADPNWPEGPDGIKGSDNSGRLVGNLFYGLNKPFWFGKGTVEARSNIIMDHRHITCLAGYTNYCNVAGGAFGQGHRGGGPTIGNGTYDISNLIFTDNIIANPAFTELSWHSPMACKKVRAATFSGNIAYKVGNSAVSTDSTSSACRNLTSSQMRQNASNHPDPNRSLEDYSPTDRKVYKIVQDLLDAPQGQWPSHFTAQNLNAFLRAGFVTGGTPSTHSFETQVWSVSPKRMLRTMGASETIELATQSLTLCTNHADSFSGSVAFVVNGNRVRTENYGPFCIEGDNNAESLFAYRRSPGSFSLTVEVYSGKNLSGSRISRSYSVTVPAASTTSSNFPSSGLSINFQTASLSAPSGFARDSGRTHSSQNGFNYGWSSDRQAETRVRSSLSSSDRVRASLIRSKGASWELQVPSGNYEVEITAGDNDYIDSRLQFNVEGTNTSVYTPTSSARFAVFRHTVSVTDGKLTIRDGSSALNNKLNSIKIWKR